MKILMHVCCGPCTAYPLTLLRHEGHEVQGYFLNPNIHPFREFEKRIEALHILCRKMDFPVEIEGRYGLQEYLRRVVFFENQRCGICYEMRLEPAARQALEIGADAFTTTLLYSRFQKHELIRAKGEQVAAKFGIPFYYKDFREGWQQGIDMAIAMDLYRQPYCGCIYSEQERYDKQWRKENAKKKVSTKVEKLDTQKSAQG